MAFTLSRDFEAIVSERDTDAMKATQLLLEKSTATPPGPVVTRVSIPPERAPKAAEPLPIVHPAAPARFAVSTAFSRLRVFREKYRWYRGQGYARAAAREKAWWHARAAPCPFAAP